MNKIEIKQFLEQSSPDTILSWYTNLATPEEKLFAASLMRKVIDVSTVENDKPFNLMRDTAVKMFGSIMGIK